MPYTANANEARTRAELPPDLEKALHQVRQWCEARDFAGHEPYDLLNSPYLRGAARSSALGYLCIRAGRRFGGLQLREWLKVAPSRNPKAMGLFLSAYLDLEDQEYQGQIRSLVEHLERLRSPGRDQYCWGYDWDYMSLRGTRLPAFSPNAIATYFCASALLDWADRTGDRHGEVMARSAAEFLARHLNRSVDEGKHLCFSYTPDDRTVIHNSNVLVGELLARVAARTGDQSLRKDAERTFEFLADRQLPQGGWHYGESSVQRWIDSFHTGYNLLALSGYERATGDERFRPNWERGYRYFKQTFLTESGAVKYLDRRLWPIDIHACAVAILVLCDAAERDAEATALAVKVARFTVENMQSPDGSFAYQIRRFGVDRTPYMRWGQAWMFRAMARLRRVTGEQAGER